MIDEYSYIQLEYPSIQDNFEYKKLHNVINMIILKRSFPMQFLKKSAKIRQKVWNFVLK